MPSSALALGIEVEACSSLGFIAAQYSPIATRSRCGSRNAIIRLPRDEAAESREHGPRARIELTICLILVSARKQLVKLGKFIAAWIYRRLRTHR